MQSRYQSSSIFSESSCHGGVVLQIIVRPNFSTLLIALVNAFLSQLKNKKQENKKQQKQAQDCLWFYLLNALAWIQSRVTQHSPVKSSPGRFWCTLKTF